MENKIENSSSFDSREQKNSIDCLESNGERKIDGNNKPSFSENMNNTVIKTRDQANKVDINSFKVYSDANLKPQVVNDKKCLIKTDINYDQKDVNGETNLDKMKQGKSPIAENGDKIELHHDQQDNNGMLVELTKSEHMGNGNNKMLHEHGQESQIDKNRFNTIKSNHWKTRAEAYEKSKA